jgi:hypothetical protein
LSFFPPANFDAGSLSALFILSRSGCFDGYKKILFITDSFVKAVIPFLALGVENIATIDLRGFTGSVKTYVKQNDPDMVIVMYNPSAIKAPDYAAHTSMFDFR